MGDSNALEESFPLIGSVSGVPGVQVAISSVGGSTCLALQLLSESELNLSETAFFQAVFSEGGMG